MKRDRKPCTTDLDMAYPPCLPRRAFLREFCALSTTAAAGATGALLLWPEETRAAQKGQKKRYRFSMPILQAVVFPGSNARPERLIVMTGDVHFHRFIQSPPKGVDLQGTLTKELRSADASVLHSGQKLSRLERQLGGSLSKAFRAHTGRKTTDPDVLLMIGELKTHYLGGTPPPPGHLSP